MPAPLGNQNSTLERRAFANAVRRAVVQQDGKALREIVDSLIVKATEGDVQAIKEVADRLDGKPKQQTELSGDLNITHSLAHVIGSIGESSTNDS